MPRIFPKRHPDNGKRAVSAVVGAIMLFGMIFAVGGTYLYFLSVDQNIYQQAAQSDIQQVQQQNLEHLVIFGSSTAGVLTFSVNNTGISTTVTAIWVMNATSGAVLNYENQTYFWPVANQIKPNPPVSIISGGSQVFNTSLVISSGANRYIIKVVSSRGTTAVGTYPSQQINSAAVNSLVAGGFGSLQMTFSSFSWYDYTSGPPNQDSGQQDDPDFTNLCANGANCAGGSYTIDIAHPHPGSLLPGGYGTDGNCPCTNVPFVLSVNITNDDPNLGTIVINAESNLWIMQTCDSGVTEGSCPNGNPVYVFYLMNVNTATGAITSTTPATFTQITLPYGVTKTLFYGSTNPLLFGNYGPVSLSNDGNTNQYIYGQYSVFLLFSGTKITSTAVSVYGQNLPFESTTSVDDIGWYSETPTTCSSNTLTTFTLNVNNSAFSYSTIKQVVVNATAFTGSVSTGALPSGWTGTGTGTITFKDSSSSKDIPKGGNFNFQWKGTSPTTSTLIQSIFPVTITWRNGQSTTLQADAYCNV